MKLSDIRGRRSLDIIADAMELAEMVGGDDRFRKFLEDLREHREDKSQLWRSFCRHLPAILRDDRYADRVVSIMAAANGVTVEEYAEDGELLRDLFELFTSDAESLGFLMGSSARTD